MKRKKKMKTFRVSFRDTFHNCESEEQAYDALMKYLEICVRYGDVDGFNFELIEDTTPKFEPAQEEV
jgi:hypothetical protein